jgi:hypothetical protein
MGKAVRRSRERWNPEKCCMPNSEKDRSRVMRVVEEVAWAKMRR